MISALLIILLIFIYTMQSFLCKVYSDNYPGDASMTSPVFSMVSGVVVAVVTLGLSGFAFSPAPLTWLFGLVNAVMLAGYNICFISASDKGPYSVLMTCMIAGGIAIPALVAVCGFGDRGGPLKYIALVLVLVSVYLVNRKKSDSGAGERTPASFYVMCGLIALFNGGYGMLLDVQQRLTGAEDKGAMIILTYGLMAVGLGMYSLVRRRRQWPGDFRQTKKSALFLILCSVTVALAVNLLTYLIRYIGDITLLYTFDSAGTLLFSVICSVIFFKEKLSAVNMLGVALMCAGLIMVTLG